MLFHINIDIGKIIEKNKILISFYKRVVKKKIKLFIFYLHNLTPYYTINLIYNRFHPYGAQLLILVRRGITDFTRIYTVEERLVVFLYDRTDGGTSFEYS